jgi:ubiquinone/menaquinone biosynthesis C-methylase UbiE
MSSVRSDTFSESKTGQEEIESTFKWQMSTDGPETYEDCIVSTWMDDWASDLIEAGHIGPNQRVLDVACGTGIMARKAAGLVGPEGRFACVDLNEGMLRVACRCAEQTGVTGIEWYHCDVTRMPFSNGEFDVVLCQQGLQFFPDKLAALQEIKRVLVPHGTLALSVWGRPENSPHVMVICDVFTEFFGPDSTQMFKVACSLSSHDLLNNLLQEVVFSNISIKTDVKVAHHPSFARFLPAYFSIFPVASLISELTDEERNRMFHCIEKRLAPWIEKGALAVPTENNILTAENG